MRKPKISPEHIAALATVLGDTILGATTARERWDALAHVHAQAWPILKQIYTYADDSHVDTVLRMLATGRVAR